jgi:CO/xanthine dehydrogenase Mo-binding subunit
MNSSTVGRPVARVDGPAKVSGACVYAADVPGAGTLWGKFYRSPLPHARILNVDTAKAKKVPGVKAVIAAGDVSPRREGYTLQDKPIFAREKVLYCGEKVAGVAAVDKEAAEEDFIACLKAQAAAYWRVAAGQVEWQAGKAWLVNGRKAKNLGLDDLARMIEAPLKGYGHYKAEKKPSVYSFQAIAADVEVDLETGAVRVAKLYFTYDVTKVINPVIHQRQIDGAIVQGVGYSLMEEMAVDEGRVLTLSLGDYKIPNIKDVPPLLTSLVRAKEGPGPYGVKAVAEAGISIVAPAIANAIYNATGVRIMDLPVTAEKILAGLAHPSR